MTTPILPGPGNPIKPRIQTAAAMQHARGFLAFSAEKVKAALAVVISGQKKLGRVQIGYAHPDTGEKRALVVMVADMSEAEANARLAEAQEQAAPAEPTVPPPEKSGPMQFPTFVCSKCGTRATVATFPIGWKNIGGHDEGKFLCEACGRTA